MGIFNGIIEFLSNINFEVIAQLTMIAMIGIAGPAIIFLLAVRRGNL
ncbi:MULTISPECIES: photosystem II reaction center protein Ycf12/Psb30 [unclassified Thermosynechococcus]|nr:MULTISPECIES: photosystem II reaction center protein Ycf12 [unclassified Thermosynechococcus]MDR5640088.1 photosystem II reaction center protein Ycf12 [Thermosynechococcus sp. PP42]MDR7897483.1 photosystem II reaction center protein Ycf12 [Thermosynechococcus sp. JY1332]MDR7904888.1 photosystem II reaction center protein Ycf12 [Thermosynechococcus sp. JY1334]MDR7922393.1 photosystem II reaction center protein Ycf12 [Thermosynechococcus sp. HY213]MDR7992714.1 photosystem II reaction center p